MFMYIVNLVWLAHRDPKIRSSLNSNNLAFSNTDFSDSVCPPKTSQKIATPTRSAAAKVSQTSKFVYVLFSFSMQSTSIINS